MVLYGIWLIDGNSGLLLSHITVPGFSFNPDLFSGFIAATHDFAQETSGGKLDNISLGNFKLLIRRERVLMKVLAVGARDPEARYDQFFKNLETKIEPIVAPFHREPDGFKAVTIELRKKLLEIIKAELERFGTRKAPADLSELAILQDENAQTILRALLQSDRLELVPELAITKAGYSYPLASSILGLPDEETLLLLERLADYGLLLSEPADTALCCPNCGSLHLHPHILCPLCKSPTQPVEFYEHLSCGHISIKHNDILEIRCSQCEVQNGADHEFRVFRGYQCPQCNATLKQPLMIFICHSCHTNTAPESAEFKILKKFIINPVLVPELEMLLSGTPVPLTEPTPAESKRVLDTIKDKVTQQPALIEAEVSKEETLKSQVTESPLKLTNPKPIQSKTTSSPKTAISSNSSSEPEVQIHAELKELEDALNAGTITEAEYDRKFVHLRLQLRRLKSQSL